MIQDLINNLLSALSSNNLFSTGFFLMMIGSLGMSMRKIPLQIGQWIFITFTSKIEILNHDAFFESVKIWFNLHPYSDKNRNVTVTSYGRSHKDPIILSPGIGNHFVKYKNRWLWINISREQTNEATSFKPREVIVIRSLGRNQKYIRDFVEEVKATEANFDSSLSNIYLLDDGFWEKYVINDLQTMKDVILPKKDKENLVKDIESFLSSKEWYSEKNVAFRRGYLFYGLPGTGKTSVIRALANEYKLNLYLINLSGYKGSDDSFNSAIRRVKNKSIIVIEDIDASFVGRKNMTKNSDISFSGLLNALDGICGKEEIMVMITTNHIEKLDPALIRPGRVDYKIEFRNADRNQIRELMNKFFGKEILDVILEEKIYPKLENKVTMAQLQNYLLMNRDIDSFVSNIDNVVNIINSEEEVREIEAEERKTEDKDTEQQNYSTPKRSPGRLMPQSTSYY